MPLAPAVASARSTPPGARFVPASAAAPSRRVAPTAATPRPAHAAPRAAPAAPRPAPAVARPAPARPASNVHPSPPHRTNPAPANRNASPRSGPCSNSSTAPQAKCEHQILFQHFFKSVGPRTYAAQVKEAGNGNHYLVLTEGKRDDKTGDVRKTRLFVFSEDFEAFFDLLRRTEQFIKAHPLPREFRAKRERFWAKKAACAETPSGTPRKEGVLGAERAATLRKVGSRRDEQTHRAGTPADRSHGRNP
jgi:hypothetical protein